MRKTELIRRIVKLDTFVRRGEPQKSGTDGFLQFPASAVGRDGAYLLVNPKSGSCALVSWLESGHNGDAYGETRNDLDGTFALDKLKEAEACLFQRARKMVEDDAKQERFDRDRERLDKATRLAVFGR